MKGEPFFKVDRVDLEFLRRDWENLAEPYTADRRIVERWFQHLVKLYSARGRAYHNLSHIRSLMVLGDSVKGRLRNCDGLKFAVWFHDAVYHTRRKDNEERSAELASQSLIELGVPAELRELVGEMILATKQHQTDGSSTDLDYFLDLDLSILGSEEQTYLRYSAAIRREYWWVPRGTYRRGRQEVLASFLNRKSIYYTEEMGLRYEQQARRNIEHEIESLLTNTRT